MTLFEQNHLPGTDKVTCRKFVNVDSTRQIFGIEDNLMLPCSQFSEGKSCDFPAENIVDTKSHIALIRQGEGYVRLWIKRIRMVLI